MAKDWDYANLTKLASANGGPKELLKKHAALYMEKGFSEGFKKGAASKNPVIAVVGVVGIVLGSGSMWAYGKYRQKKALTTASKVADNAEISKVEEELISIIEAAQEIESGEITETHEGGMSQEDDNVKKENRCNL